MHVSRLSACSVLWLILAVLSVGYLAVGCGGGEASSRPVVPGRASGERPLVAPIVREGDPEAALALAVWTYGIAPDRSAQPAIALAALTQSRLAVRWPDAIVTPSWEGYRVRGLLAGASDPVSAIQSALLAPVQAQEMGVILKKLRALAPHASRTRKTVQQTAVTRPPMRITP